MSKIIDNRKLEMEFIDYYYINTPKLCLAKPTDWTSLLLFPVMGLLPAIPSWGVSDARKGLIFKNVQTVFILHIENHWWSPNGARPSHHFCHSNLLDGRAKTLSCTFLNKHHFPFYIVYLYGRACTLEQL